VGNRTATLLAKQFQSMDKLMSANVEVLSNINEIGPIIAQSVYDYLHSKLGSETITDLKNLGVNMKSTTREVGSKKLEGMTVVVTGTLKNYSREKIEETIALHGGRAVASVSKNTDFVILGENPGSKMAKARELGVRVINEEEFQNMLN